MCFSVDVSHRPPNCGSRQPAGLTPAGSHAAPRARQRSVSTLIVSVLSQSLRLLPLLPHKGKCVPKRFLFFTAS